MRKWLEKKSIQAVLGIILLCIWGYNAYSIVGITTEDEATPRLLTKNVDVNLDELKISERVPYVYQADFRDPFKPNIVRQVPQKKRTTIPEPRKEVHPPVLMLTGVVEEMALLKNKNGQVFFISAGDSVEGAYVRSVTSDSVMLKFKSQDITIKMNN